jgi:phosphohistidine swiveling domain-containing protein
MTKYTKAYTRENTLFCIQVWEEQQARRLDKYFGWNVPTSVFDVSDGVAKVYYHKNIFDIWFDLIAKKNETDPKVISDILDLYSKQIDQLEETWKKGIITSKSGLIDFFDFMAEAWIGLSVSYCLPEIKSLPKKLQDLGMALRTRSGDFLDGTDKVIYKSLVHLYPNLGDLVRYLAIEEIQQECAPSTALLEARKKHYVYFDFKVLTNVDAKELAKQNGILIIDEYVPEKIAELKGQIAMKGKVRGTVRVLHKKSEVGELLDGEILVTAMTTPDYLPAMHRAAAFVTDEGGITCHAAIVAREIGKPCIIGTKIATEVLKNGDEVEVDAEKGIVKILK